ncbi:MAG: BON domain-containing protein [Deltaproteobacteria bacterium]|nr:BON domain-containing protein [Deltaproteobacteria bacterium]
MNRFHSIPTARLLALACALLLAMAGTGCGDPTPEEQLADATKELASASQAKTAAQTTLDQLERRLEDAQAARDKAAAAFEEVRERWASAKNAVGEFATDEVLHRQVNRALLEEPELEGATITAGVQDRVVTLIGGAPNAEVIALATELASAVPGVAAVKSDVIVESNEAGGTEPDDAEPVDAEPADAEPDDAEPDDSGVTAPEISGNVIPELPGLDDEEAAAETHL